VTGGLRHRPHEHMYLTAQLQYDYISTTVHKVDVVPPPHAGGSPSCIASRETVAPDGPRIIRVMFQHYQPAERTPSPAPHLD
jgi:hypothetical protein